MHLDSLKDKDFLTQAIALGIQLQQQIADCSENQTESLNSQTAWADFSSKALTLEQKLTKKWVGKYKWQLEALMMSRKSVIKTQTISLWMSKQTN